MNDYIGLKHLSTKKNKLFKDFTKHSSLQVGQKFSHFCDRGDVL